MLIAVVGIVGTLLGAIVSGVISHLTAARVEDAARRERQRDRIRAAAGALAAALIAYRRHAYLKINARREGIEEGMSQRRLDRYAAHSEMTTALAALELGRHHGRRRTGTRSPHPRDGEPVNTRPAARPCHWHDEDDEGTGRWLVPGCMTRMHDPDSDPCDCPTTADQLAAALVELETWCDAITRVVHDHPDHRAIMRAAAQHADTPRPAIT